MSRKNIGKIDKVTNGVDFTMIPNEIIRDKSMSIEERILLIYLLSLPSNTSIVKTGMHNYIGMGRERMSKAWNRLVDKGYIESQKLVGGRNQFYYEYKVHIEIPLSG